MSAWIDEEPSAELIDETSYLLRRSTVRWRATLAIALVVALAVVALHGRTPRRFESTVVFSATEGDLDGETAPRQSRELGPWVETALLSNARLYEVIRRHGLYAPQLALGPSQALEAFRDDLRVEVWRNYFLVERESRNDPARSTRLSITFAAADPALALAIAQELGRVMVAAEEETRKGDAARTTESLARALDDRRADLVSRREAVTRAQIDLFVKPSPELAVALVGRRADLVRAEESLAGLAARQATLALRVRIEERALGLRFDRVDAGRAESVRLARRAELALLGALTLLFALPLTALTLAVFDARIRSAEDLRRLGVTSLGHLLSPALPV